MWTRRQFIKSSLALGVTAMGKFNRFKYGDGTKYGFQAGDEEPIWVLQVAWDGTHDEQNEMSWATKMSVRRGRSHYVGSAGAGFERIPPGTATIILDNSDGRYDPLNTSSPLYPNVRPGKFVRLWFRDASTVGDDYQVMRGIVTEILPFGGPRAFVRLVITDGLAWLQDKVVTWALVSSAKYTAFISTILLAAGWPQDEWGIVASSGGQTATRQWAWREQALPLINALMTAEVGLFFQNKEGYSIARARDKAQSSVATLTEDKLLNQPLIRYGWESVRNTIQVYTYNKPAYVAGTIWDLNNTAVSIADQETKYFWVEFDFAGNRDVAGIIGSFNYSFEVNTQSDGGGVDLTALCSIGVSYVGGGCLLTIWNNSGSTGYFVQLAIDGNVYATEPPVIIERSDATSQADYGQRTLTLKSTWQQSIASAEAIAAGLLAELKDPRPLPVIQIEDRLLVQYDLDIFDRVTVELDSLGLSDDFRIGAIEHEWTGPSGMQSRTTLTLEPYFTLAIT